jgi:serine phosphatase RsbU (regulator of sigma subunit)
MKKIIAILMLPIGLLLWHTAAWSVETIVFPDNAPVITPIKPASLQVLVEKEGMSTIDAVMNASGSFAATSEVGPIQSTKTYWLSFELKNDAARDRDFRLTSKTFGLIGLQVYLIHENGDRLAYEKNFATLPPVNEFSRVSPFMAHDPPTESQYLVLPLRRNETARVYARVLPDQRFLPQQFNFLSIVDHAKYLELRRFGLYVEGALAGALFALAIFGWYSHFRHRDHTSLMYGVWILFALGSVLVLGVHDGQRLAEFFIGFDSLGSMPNGLSVRNAVGYCVAGGQSITYILFARSFLDVRERFPIFYKITNIWIAFYILQLTTNLAFRHTIPPTWLWNPLLIWLVLNLLGIYVCAFIRLREGMTIARFFMVAMVPYVLFRSLFLLGVAGIQSPVALLPDIGLFFQFKDANSMQGFGVVCEALIMALAVVARSRWLQDELTQSMKVQRELVENQNKVLEETVQARTRQLEEQHRELNDAHRLIVSSVDYASRLQRSQLPKPHRIEGRFASVGVIWQPRDTIGGDLWWLSSAQRSGPFMLAVADCTGHGVPGAMLSLLVSNSLERIYSGDPDKSPAEALMMLDHLVRTGLNQDADSSESDDGCDAMIMRIDRSQQEIIFSGAKIGAFQLTAEGTVIRHLPTRASLGYCQPPDPEDEPNNQTIRYQPGDTFVIVTDGFTDQIGGDLNSPSSFGYRRIEKVMTDSKNLASNQIADALKEAYESWRGEQKPRDDLTVIVFTL